MNRRSFFSRLGLAAAGFTILPAATTYGRIWKPTRTIVESPRWVLNPAWVDAPYELRKGIFSPGAMTVFNKESAESGFFLGKTQKPISLNTEVIRFEPDGNGGLKRVHPYMQEA